MHDGAVAEPQHRRVEAAEDVQEVSLAAGQLDRGPLGGLQHHLGHRHVDVLTDAGAIALQQRGEDADRRLQPRVQVGVRHGLGRGSACSLRAVNSINPSSACITGAYARRPAIDARLARSR